MTRLGVLGWPVGHSRSPAMQRAALREAGLDGWTYQLLPVPPELFDETVRGAAGRGLRRGQRDDPAQGGGARRRRQRDAAGAARSAQRTRSRSPHDGIEADNTDAPGLLAAIGDVPASALVLGAGGSARAAVHALAGAGCEVLDPRPDAQPRRRACPATVVDRPVDGAGARQLHARRPRRPRRAAARSRRLRARRRPRLPRGRNGPHARRDRPRGGRTRASWCVRARCPSRAGQGAGTARRHARSRPRPLIWGSSDLAIWPMFVGRGGTRQTRCQTSRSI